MFRLGGDGDITIACERCAGGARACPCSSADGCPFTATRKGSNDRPDSCAAAGSNGRPFAAALAGSHDGRRLERIRLAFHRDGIQGYAEFRIPFELACRLGDGYSPTSFCTRGNDLLFPNNHRRSERRLELVAVIVGLRAY